MLTVERSLDEAWRDHPGGYRGYNFTAYPSPGLRHDWTSLYCEIQIKTMIQEAWDAMTHDLVYKRQRAIPKILRKQFATFSKGLYTWEENAGTLRDNVEDLWKRANDHGRVAVLGLMQGALKPLQQLRTINTKIPKISTKDLDHDRSFTHEEIAQINETIRSKVHEEGSSLDLCHVAAMTALCSRSPAQIDFAIQLTDRYVMGLGDSAQAETFRADIYWALGRFADAVEAAEQARSFLREEDNVIDGHFCYYVSDAQVFHNFVPTKTLDEARSIAERLVENPRSIGDLDTAGFAKIALGKDDKEVRAGIAMVKKNLEAALAVDDEQTKQLAIAFSTRHIHLGEMRLQGNLGWWK